MDAPDAANGQLTRASEKLPRETEFVHPHQGYLQEYLPESCEQALDGGVGN